MSTTYKSKSRKSSLTPAAVRAFAQEKGLPGAGSRGRMSASLFVAYLAANPKVAREVAKEVGVAIGPRAKLTEARLVEVANLIR